MKNKKLIICLSILFILILILVKLDALIGVDSFAHDLVTIKVSDGLTSFNKIITFLGSTKFIVGLETILFIMFIIMKKNKYSYISLSILVVSTILNNIIKLIVQRERPIYMMVTEKSYSFPSGHTMASVTLYGILFYLVNKMDINKTLKKVLSIILIIIPVMVAISRIYLGAHFFSDVLAGAILSLILILITINIVEKKKLI